MKEALYETTLLRQFAGLSLERISDETTILNFRRLLEKYELVAGTLAVINGYLGDRGLSLRQDTVVDATLIYAPNSAKNQDGKRGPEMHQTVILSTVLHSALPFPILMITGKVLRLVRPGPGQRKNWKIP